jgi:hypothetical protein
MPDRCSWPYNVTVGEMQEHQTSAKYHLYRLRFTTTESLDINFKHSICSVVPATQSCCRNTTNQRRLNGHSCMRWKYRSANISRIWASPPFLRNIQSALMACSECNLFLVDRACTTMRVHCRAPTWTAE